MATVWSRKCTACGYSVSGRSTSYNGATIGPPMTKCPQCGHVQKIKTHKEWIQLSSFAKMIYVLNQSFSSVLITLCCAFTGVAVPGILEAPVFVRILGFVLGLVLGFFASYHIQVRTRTFLMTYAYSLHRTDSEEYRRMLDLPDPTDQMTAIPFYSLDQHKAEQVSEIRAKEILEHEYYSSFSEL